jgi:ATP-dependent Clp protease ATP-binding subunit ClpA
MSTTSLNPNLLTPRLTELLTAAVALSQRKRKSNLMPEAVLLTLLDAPNHTARRVLDYFVEKRGTDLGRLERLVRNTFEARKDAHGDLELIIPQGVFPLSKGMIIALDEALSIANALDEVYIDADHLLAAFCEPPLGTAPLLAQNNITKTAMLEALNPTPILASAPSTKPNVVKVRLDEAPAPPTAPSRLSNTTVDWVAMAKSGEVRAVYFRESLLRDLLQLMAHSKNRHVILLGADGVGKRTLAYSLALMIAAGRAQTSLKSLVQVREQALLDNPVEAMQIALKQAVGGVLFVPFIGRFFGPKATFPKAGLNLQKAILANDPLILGTATQSEWEARSAENAALREHCQVLRVPPTNAEETLEILKVLRPHLSAEYGLNVAEDALNASATLAARYMADTPLPRGAEHLLHRAAAMVKLGQAQDANLDAEDVMLAAAQMTGVPVSKMGQEDRTKYARMVESLQERIIGQEKAILAVSRAVKIARVGLRSPKRPIGSFLFLGPSGVGKTELAKALAAFLFDDEEAMLALDMSEYMDENSVSRLIGAPPGYVGYEAGGQLTERVRKQPYIVVLFDEIEKAHLRVLDLLLQVLEEGRLTDSQGNVATFSESVVILTSNLGARYLEDPVLTPEAEAAVMNEVKAVLRPEFVNRLDEVVIFHPLSTEQLGRILSLMLKKEAKIAAENGLKLSITQAAQDWLLAQNTEPQYGARPLRRLIQRHITEPLADFLLEQGAVQGQPITIDAKTDGSGLSFTL